MGRLMLDADISDPVWNPGDVKRMLSAGLWYLATVYTKHPGGLEKAYTDANEAAAHVIQNLGARIFCPIGHSHSLCAIYGTKGGLNGETDAEFWKWFDAPFLEKSDGLIVVMMPGWKQSYGIDHEIDVMSKAGKPILFLDWPTLTPVRVMRSVSVGAPVIPMLDPARGL